MKISLIRSNKNSIILLFIFIIYIYFTKDTDYLSKSYQKKFIFNKYSYNYYDILTKIILLPRSSIKYLNVLQKLNLNKNDVILDIGSGDGFNLLYFNKKYNFKKIIGVEIDKNIYDICKTNIGMIDNKKIEIYNENILKYNFPIDISIFYLFNPFEQNYFIKDKEEYNKYTKLANKIKDSYLANKRSIRIIFMNLNDNKINDIFKKHFKVLENNYFTEFFLIKVNYTIFYIN